jgi:hypothetical protein
LRIDREHELRLQYATEACCKDGAMKFTTPLGVFLATMLASCLSLTQVADAQSSSALNLVAISGKQRMLSQRVFKAYAQWSLGVLPDKAGVILSTSLAELKKDNALLRETSNEVVLAGAQAQAALIDKLAAATGAAPTQASLQQTALVSEDLLINAEALTQALIKSTGEAPAALVNLAARQRMLSQRAAGLFLGYQTPAKTPEMKTRALRAATEFKAALNAFEDAKAEFPQIADRLDTARMQMIFFDNALSNIDNPAKEQFTTVATTSERILGEMDLMTGDVIKQLAARNVTTAKKP